MKNWLIAIIIVVLVAALALNGALYYQANNNLKIAQVDINSVKQNVSALTTSINNLETRINDTTSALKNLQTQVAGASSSIKALENETASLVTVSSNLTDQVASLKDKVSSEASQITSLGDRTGTLEAWSHAVVDAVKKVLPGVVFISVERTTGEVVSGSGIIVRSDGYILTNRHVVNDARHVEVTLHDRRSYEPSGMWLDDILDLAVVKIEENNLPTVSFGNPDTINVGDPVIAIGHALGLSPLEGGATVTEGIVSNLGRSFFIDSTPYYDVIQTSAAINPGNSGGPLVNLAGELIGVNSAGANQAQNIGFAINVATARHVYEDLVKYGRPVHPYLGLALGDVTMAMSSQIPGVKFGAVVTSLETGGPAYLAGLQLHDIITGFGKDNINSAADLIRVLWRHGAGDTVEVVFWRGGTQMKVAMTLMQRPPKSDLV